MVSLGARIIGSTSHCNLYYSILFLFLVIQCDRLAQHNWPVPVFGSMIWLTLCSKLGHFVLYFSDFHKNATNMPPVAM
jgi:hypothetical protein